MSCRRLSPLSHHLNQRPSGFTTTDGVIEQFLRCRKIRGINNPDGGYRPRRRLIRSY